MTNQDNTQADGAINAHTEQSAKNAHSSQAELRDGYLRAQLDYAPKDSEEAFEAWCKKYKFDCFGLDVGRQAWCSSLGTYFRGADGVAFIDGEMTLFYEDDLLDLTSHTNKAIADVLDRLGETIPFSNSTSDELDKSNTHLDSRSQQYWSAYNKGYISMSDQTKAAIQAERQKLTIKEVL